MLIVIILLVIVIGLLVLAAVIGFSNSEYKKNGETTDYREEKNTSNDSGLNKKLSSENYLPVLDVEVPIKELKKEIVHYKGKGKFFQIEDQERIDNIEIDILNKTEKSSVIDGVIYLTSRWIAIVNNSKKKIALKTIDNYRFEDGFLIIKRKGVKKRKDIFEILEDKAKFYYILKVLVR